MSQESAAAALTTTAATAAAAAGSGDDGVVVASRPSAPLLSLTVSGETEPTAPQPVAATTTRMIADDTSRVGTTTAMAAAGTPPCSPATGPLPAQPSPSSGVNELATSRPPAAGATTQIATTPISSPPKSSADGHVRRARTVAKGGKIVVSVVTYLLQGSYLPIFQDKVRNNVRSRWMLMLVHSLVIMLAFLLVMFSVIGNSNRPNLLSFTVPPRPTSYLGVPTPQFSVRMLDGHRKAIVGTLMRVKFTPIDSIPIDVELSLTDRLTSRRVVCLQSLLQAGALHAFEDGPLCDPESNGLVMNSTAVTDDSGEATFASVTLAYGSPGTYLVTVGPSAVFESSAVQANASFFFSFDPIFVTAFMEVKAATRIVSAARLLGDPNAQREGSSSSASLPPLPMSIQINTPMSFTVQAQIASIVPPVVASAAVIPLSLMAGVATLQSASIPYVPLDGVRDKSAFIANAVTGTVNFTMLNATNVSAVVASFLSEANAAFNFATRDQYGAAAGQVFSTAAAVAGDAISYLPQAAVYNVTFTFTNVTVIGANTNELHLGVFFFGKVFLLSSTAFVGQGMSPPSNIPPSAVTSSQVSTAVAWIGGDASNSAAAPTLGPSLMTTSTSSSSPSSNRTTSTSLPATTTMASTTSPTTTAAPPTNAGPLVVVEGEPFGLSVAIHDAAGRPVVAKMAFVRAEVSRRNVGMCNSTAAASAAFESKVLVGQLTFTDNNGIARFPTRFSMFGETGYYTLIVACDGVSANWTTTTIGGSLASDVSTPQSMGTAGTLIATGALTVLVVPKPSLQYTLDATNFSVPAWRMGTAQLYDSVLSAWGTTPTIVVTDASRLGRLDWQPFVPGKVASIVPFSSTEIGLSGAVSLPATDSGVIRFARVRTTFLTRGGVHWFHVVADGRAVANFSKAFEDPASVTYLWEQGLMGQPGCTHVTILQCPTFLFNNVKSQVVLQTLDPMGRPAPNATVELTQSGELVTQNEPTVTLQTNLDGLAVLPVNVAGFAGLFPASATLQCVSPTRSNTTTTTTAQPVTMPGTSSTPSGNVTTTTTAMSSSSFPSTTTSTTFTTATMANGTTTTVPATAPPAAAINFDDVELQPTITGLCQSRVIALEWLLGENQKGPGSAGTSTTFPADSYRYVSAARNATRRLRLWFHPTAPVSPESPVGVRVLPMWESASSGYTPPADIVSVTTLDGAANCTLPAGVATDGHVSVPCIDIDLPIGTTGPATGVALLAPVVDYLTYGNLWLLLERQPVVSGVEIKTSCFDELPQLFGQVAWSPGTQCHAIVDLIPSANVADPATHVALSYVQVFAQAGLVTDSASPFSASPSDTISWLDFTNTSSMGDALLVMYLSNGMISVPSSFPLFVNGTTPGTTLRSMLNLTIAGVRSPLSRYAIRYCALADLSLTWNPITGASLLNRSSVCAPEPYYFRSPIVTFATLSPQHVTTLAGAEIPTITASLTYNSVLGGSFVNGPGFAVATVQARDAAANPIIYRPNPYDAAQHVNYATDGSVVNVSGITFPASTPDGVYDLQIIMPGVTLPLLVVVDSRPRKMSVLVQPPTNIGVSGFFTVVAQVLGHNSMPLPNAQVTVAMSFGPCNNITLNEIPGVTPSGTATSDIANATITAFTTCASISRNAIVSSPTDNNGLAQFSLTIEDSGTGSIELLLHVAPGTTSTTSVSAAGGGSTTSLALSNMVLGQLQLLSVGLGVPVNSLLSAYASFAPDFLTALDIILSIANNPSLTAASGAAPLSQYIFQGMSLLTDGLPYVFGASADVNALSAAAGIGSAAANQLSDVVPDIVTRNMTVWNVVTNVSLAAALSSTHFGSSVLIPHAIQSHQTFGWFNRDDRPPRLRLMSEAGPVSGVTSITVTAVMLDDDGEVIPVGGQGGLFNRVRSAVLGSGPGPVQLDWEIEGPSDENGIMQLTRLRFGVTDTCKFRLLFSHHGSQPAISPVISIDLQFFSLFATVKYAALAAVAIFLPMFMASVPHTRLGYLITSVIFAFIFAAVLLFAAIFLSVISPAAILVQIYVDVCAGLSVVVFVGYLVILVAVAGGRIGGRRFMWMRRFDDEGRAHEIFEYVKWLVNVRLEKQAPSMPTIIDRAIRQWKGGASTIAGKVEGTVDEVKTRARLSEIVASSEEEWSDEEEAVCKHYAGVGEEKKTMSSSPPQRANNDGTTAASSCDTLSKSGGGDTELRLVEEAAAAAASLQRRSSSSGTRLSAEQQGLLAASCSTPHEQPSQLPRRNSGSDGGAGGYSAVAAAATGTVVRSSTTQSPNATRTERRVAMVERGRPPLSYKGVNDAVMFPANFTVVVGITAVILFALTLIFLYLMDLLNYLCDAIVSYVPSPDQRSLATNSANVVFGVLNDAIRIMSAIIPQLGVLSHLIQPLQDFDFMGLLGTISDTVVIVKSYVPMSFGIGLTLANLSVIGNLAIVASSIPKYIRVMRRGGAAAKILRLDEHSSAYGSPVAGTVELYIGMQCIHCAVLFVASFTFAITLGTILGVPGSRMWVWGLLKNVILAGIVGMLVNLALQMLLVRRFLSSGWLLLRPEAYSLNGFIQVILGVFTGAFQTVIRFAMGIGSAIFAFAALNVSIFPGVLSMADLAHTGYCSMVAVEANQGNPVMLCFVGILLGHVELLRQGIDVHKRKFGMRQQQQRHQLGKGGPETAEEAKDEAAAWRAPGYVAVVARPVGSINQDDNSVSAPLIHGSDDDATTLADDATSTMNRPTTADAVSAVAVGGGGRNNHKQQLSGGSMASSSCEGGAAVNPSSLLSTTTYGSSLIGHNATTTAASLPDDGSDCYARLRGVLRQYRRSVAASEAVCGGIATKSCVTCECCCCTCCFSGSEWGTTRRERLGAAVTTNLARTWLRTLNGLNPPIWRSSVSSDAARFVCNAGETEWRDAPMSAENYARRYHRDRVARRWWLFVLLTWNPSLRAMRKRRVVTGAVLVDDVDAVVPTAVVTR